MRRIFSQLALASCAFAGGAIFSSSVRAENDDGDGTYRKLAIFARVLNYVENNYVTAVSSEQLIYGAIRGMLATLDAHSTFMDPEQFAAVKSEAQGEFGGVGIEVVQRDDKMVIVSRYDDTPAHRAGLVVGDAIVGVDHAPVKGLGLSEVVRRIKGAPGTEVMLTLERLRGGAVEDVRLVRDRISVVSVDARRIEEFGYIKIRSFTERTATDVTRALEQLKKEGALEGMVIDVRDNPGGLLDQAVRVADLWLQSGVIVSTEGRFRQPDVESAHPKGTEADYPLVLLVNGGTASASEIVAGAMQDHARGTVMGTQSFGKGSVQTVIELEDQSALKLTIARYFTPKHRSIQGTGITPDIVVPAATTGDNQLQAALEHLRTRPKSPGRQHREAGMRVQ